MLTAGEYEEIKVVDIDKGVEKVDSKSRLG
jgi:hypothetical protein